MQSHQDHLFRFRDSLSETQQVILHDQVSAIDFAQIDELYATEDVVETGAAIARSAAAPSTLIPADLRQQDPAAYRRAEDLGWEMLKNGRVAVVLVAGGEGTRLGFPHPKGKFPIGPVSHKSLYQMLAEQVVAISTRAGATIPYYVMTSDATDAETQAFFVDHDYFGLDPSAVQFFRQGKMPAVDQQTGRVLLADKHTVAFSPDGHGGLLEAMRRAQVFEDLQRRNVEILFYHQVDNPLVRVCDPAFIGFHVHHRADISTKVVTKQDPAEKVGLLVEVNRRHHIVEYTDLPKELAAERDQSGALRLRCGNIAVHIFRTDFLVRMANDPKSLPFHRSSKSVAHVSDAGEIIKPEVPNAFKFERFIFDILPNAERPIAMEVVREEEFMPLKNREGDFSPDYVRTAIRRLHTGWLRAAGWTDAEEMPVEIPASVALSGPDFLERRAR